MLQSWLLLLQPTFSLGVGAGVKPSILASGSSLPGSAAQTRSTLLMSSGNATTSPLLAKRSILNVRLSGQPNKNLDTGFSSSAGFSSSRKRGHKPEWQVSEMLLTWYCSHGQSSTLTIPNHGVMSSTVYTLYLWLNILFGVGFKKCVASWAQVSEAENHIKP